MIISIYCEYIAFTSILCFNFIFNRHIIEIQNNKQIKVEKCRLTAMEEKRLITLQLFFSETCLSFAVYHAENLRSFPVRLLIL